MDKRKERDLLIEYTEHLVGRRRGPLQPTSQREVQVQGLLDLAEQVHGILLPVKPDVNYRRRLHGDLILKAQGRTDEPQHSRLREHRKGILIGAALGSLASVVGVVIAFVLRHRHSRATHVATG